MVNAATPNAAGDGRQETMSRRQLLGRAAIASASLAIASLMAACQGSAASTVPSSGSPAAKVASSSSGAVSPASSAPAAAAASASPANAATSRPQAPAKMASVKVGAGLTFNTFPVNVGIDKGFFAEQAIDAQYQSFVSAGPARAALVGNSIELLVLAVEHSVILTSKALPTQSLVGVQIKGAYALVVRNDLPGKPGDLSALRGTKIAITTPGSGSDLSLRALLKASDVQPEKEVTILAMQSIPAVVASVQHGQVDGFLAASPEVETALGLGVGKIWLDLRKGEGPPSVANVPNASIMAQKSWIDAHPDEAARIVKAMTKTLSWIHQNPAETAVIAKKYFTATPDDVLLSIVQAYLTGYDPHLSRETIDYDQQYLIDSEQLKAKLPYEQLVASQYAPLWDVK